MPIFTVYNSCKKGSTVKIKVSFEILLEIFTFGPLVLKLWQKQLSSDPSFFSAILSDGFFQYNSLHHLII